VALIRSCPYFTYYTSAVHITVLLKNLFIHQLLKKSTYSGQRKQIFSVPVYFNDSGVVIKYQTHEIQYDYKIATIP